MNGYKLHISSYVCFCVFKIQEKSILTIIYLCIVEEILQVESGNLH